MLVLTRKNQERIQIGDSIVVTVVRVRGNTVRLGIEAPRDVRVVRAELAPQSESSVSSPDGEPDAVGAAPAASDDEQVVQPQPAMTRRRHAPISGPLGLFVAQGAAASCG